MQCDFHRRGLIGARVFVLGECPCLPPTKKIDSHIINLIISLTNEAGFIHHNSVAFLLSPCNVTSIGEYLLEQGFLYLENAHA